MKVSDNRVLSKIAVLSVCVAMMLSLAVGCGSGSKVKWDYQADVVIIGAKTAHPFFSWKRTGMSADTRR